jgi:hypothetical protein
MGGLFSSLCGPTPPMTEVPDDYGAADVDPDLPRTHELLKAEKKVDSLWLGSWTKGWLIDRHSTSGATIGRWAQVVYIHKLEDESCLMSDVRLYQDHIDNGNFGSLRLVWADERNMPSEPGVGRRIDCSVLDRVDFGYRPGSEPPPDM